MDPMNCKTCQTVFPDLLLDPAAPANASARAHIATCAACAQELASYEATFALLDSWHAPEVSPYFDQKLAVRLREEQAAPSPGWLERIKTRLLLNTGRQFRPALAGVMALLLIAGGGGVGISTFHRATPASPVSATVNDLQILDKNEQALQQMDQLLQDDTPAEDGGTPQS
jgi:anti-sigma factor RsiW